MIKIYNIICLPALILHELLHVVMTYLVGGKVTGMDIHKYDNFNKTFGLAFELFTVSDYKFQNTLISLAPIFGFLLTPIVFYFDSTLGTYVFAYQVLTLPIGAPSSEDYTSIKEFKSTKELLRECMEDYE